MPMVDLTALSPGFTPALAQQEMTDMQEASCLSRQSGSSLASRVGFSTVIYPRYRYFADHELQHTLSDSIASSLGAAVENFQKSMFRGIGLPYQHVDLHNRHPMIYTILAAQVFQEVG